MTRATGALVFVFPKAFFQAFHFERVGVWAFVLAAGAGRFEAAFDGSFTDTDGVVD